MKTNMPMTPAELVEFDVMRDEARGDEQRSDSSLGDGDRQFSHMQSGNKRLGKHFYLFAALQLVLIVVGAVIGLFMAPVSLFVSQTEAQAIGLIIIDLLALLLGALGIITFPLSIIAAIGIGKGKRWGRSIGIATAIIALVEFPLGTAFGIYALKKLLRKKLP